MTELVSARHPDAFCTPAHPRKRRGPVLPLSRVCGKRTILRVHGLQAAACACYAAVKDMHASILSGV